MKKFFGTKQFNQTILKIAIPIMIHGIVTTGVNLVDSLMVGQLGDAVVGGVAATNRFFSFMQSGILSIVGTSGLFISQFYGAKNQEKMKESFRFSLWSSFIIMLPFFLIALLFPQVVISFFSKDDEIIQVGILYMRIACFSYIPFCITTAISTALRSIGKQQIQLYVSLISVIIKIVLNEMLLFGYFGFPELGIQGAAISTLITRSVEASIYLIILYYNNFSFMTKLSEIHHISFHLIKNILIKAFPLCINDLLWSGSNSVILKLMGTRGTSYYNGFAICATISDIYYSLNTGFGNATIVYISKRLGENKLKQAKKEAYQTIGLASMTGLFLCITLFISAYLIPVIYSETSFEVQIIAQNLIKMQSFFFFFYTLTMQNYFIFNSGGDTRSIFIMDAGLIWLFQIPLLIYVTYFTDKNLYALYAICQSNEIVKFIVSSFLLKKGRWINNLTIK